MSKQYENDFAKRVHRRTPDFVRSYRCGYSGSNAMPQPDVLITLPSRDNFALELKGPIKGDTIAVEEEDLLQLAACETARTQSALVVKFQNRKPLVVRFFSDIVGLDTDDMSVADVFKHAVPECFNPRVSTSDKTGTTRLYLDKPSTDHWSSARAFDGDDIDAVLETLGVPKNE